jgi:NADPH:quinone reductase
MKAIVFDKIGSPSEVLRLAELPVPEINDDEVLVKMVSASINPGDFLFIQNLYPEPKRPHFPEQIAGNHGSGIIAKVGKKAALKPGTFVAFSYYNTWAEYAAVPAEWLIPLPSEYPIEKAGQLVNPITAWDLLSETGVRPGQWLALTAGNSTTATMVSQFAKHKKVNVISIVRRPTQDLKALGASAVIELSSLSGPDFDPSRSAPPRIAETRSLPRSGQTIGLLAQSVSEQIMKITQNQGVNGVIDCVGGPLAGELIRSLAIGGQFVIYGGFSPEKFELHNFDILMKGSTIESHIYRYFFAPPKESDHEVLSQIIEIFGRPEFVIPIGGVHPLDDFKSAIDETLNRPERGKHFFKMA